MRTLTQEYFGGLEIDEDMYKADLAALNLYQSFSSEILRLSLLGVAGYGFLISNIAFKVSDESKNFLFLDGLINGESWLFAGAIFLSLSAMSAMGHRHYSTDCVTHYVRRLRIRKKIDSIKLGVEDKSKLDDFFDDFSRKEIRLKYMKFKEIIENMDLDKEDKDRLDRNLKNFSGEEESLLKDTNLCFLLQALSSLFLVVGILCVAVTFLYALSSINSQLDILKKG